MGDPWQLGKLLGLEKMRGRVVLRPFQDEFRESAGKHHVAAALRKRMLDGTKGPESQTVSWFGEDRIKTKMVGKKWPRNSADR